ncbi:DUF1850 domain-containing protein [Metabacillus indicus]|uniref:DUF1850 domain-containing protein n=1 Tax=Metabacillus indicus TaxID=246786 RepID=UPI0031742445
MKRVLISILVSIIVLIFISLFPFFKAVVFQYEDTGRLLAYLMMEDEDHFQMKYTHSIHLTDVIETYKVSEGEIRQTELSYETFAVGMPSGPEGNETFERKDGKYILSNMDRRFPFIDLATGQVVANHRVIMNGKEYELNDYIRPGTWVRISCSKMSLFQLLKGVKINE